MCVCVCVCVFVQFINGLKLFGCDSLSLSLSLSASLSLSLSLLLSLCLCLCLSLSLQDGARAPDGSSMAITALTVCDGVHAAIPDFSMLSTLCCSALYYGGSRERVPGQWHFSLFLFWLYLGLRFFFVVRVFFLHRSVAHLL